MAIGDILEIGRQAINANRSALETSANNIANANTPGYSRQKINIESRAGSLSGGHFQGGGVDVSSRYRVHDAFVHNQMIQESRYFGAVKARSETLERLETIAATTSEKMSDHINKFFNDVRELSNNPEVMAMRNTVITSAETAAHGFKQMAESLSEMSKDIDTKIDFEITQINSRAQELASLNEKITNATALGESPNELLDKRDQIQRQLSQKLGFQTFNDERGNVNLTAGSNGFLVLAGDAYKLMTMSTEETPMKAGGSLEVYIKDISGVRKVNYDKQNGELGGLMFVRDQVINQAMKQLDKVAYAFMSEVNKVHQGGMGLDGIGGRTLFKDFPDEKGAAIHMKVNDDIKGSPERIAAGHSSTSLGDNSVALEIATLQTKDILPLNLAKARDPKLPPDTAEVGSQNITDSLASIIANIGVQSETDHAQFEHQENIVKQLESYRESMSGVSLEEEAVDIMRYQAAYNAAAKALKLGDELFEQILAIKP